MIPKANARGHSFKSVIAYLMHDKDRAKTSERVAWFETGNLPTHDPEMAAKLMAWTDLNSDFLKFRSGTSLSGKKQQAGAAYHISLAWAIGEKPNVEHQKEQGRAVLRRMGLDAHQYVMVAHKDTKHVHMHMVINLTHPETGKRHRLTQDQRILQDYALGYERKHGIHCRVREENAKTYQKTGQPTKYRDKKQDYSREVTRAFQLSDDGKSFVHALKAEGLYLAPARRASGFVVVDQKGDIQKLTRQLEPVDKYQTPITGREKGELIRERLKDIDRSTLPDADALSKQIKAELEQEKTATEEKTQEEKGIEKGDLSEEFKTSTKTEDRQKKPDPEQEITEGREAQSASDDQIYDREAQEVEQQIALMDAAHEAAQEIVAAQDRAQREDSARLKALKEKARQAQRTRDSFARRERFRRYEERLAARVEKRKEYWQVPKLEKEKKQAEQKLKSFENRHWLYKLWHRKRHEELKNNVWAAGMSLNDALERLRLEIETIYGKRQQWVIDRELQKRGFAVEAKQKPERPKLKQKKTENTKAKAEKQKTDKMQDLGNRKKERVKSREAESVNDNQIQEKALKEEFSGSQVLTDKEKLAELAKEFREREKDDREQAERYEMER